jgi:hypothetical protein
MMNLKKYFLLIIVFSVLMCKINAQSFSASVNNTTVGTNEPFEVSFQFNGNDINSLKNFRAPDFRNFKVLSGPNQSTSMQIINGSVSASLTYSFYITALSTGEFTISSASIDFKGRTYTSDPIKINVVKGTAPQAQQQNKNDQSANVKSIGDNVFIKAIVDRQKVFKGEQVTVTYKLYTTLNISSPQISKLPQYQGFWAEEIDSPNRIFFTTEVVNGKRFNVATLKKAALFPTETGKLSVTPFELTIPVIIPKQRRRGDIFDEFFNDPFFSQNQTVDYKATSNTVKIDVLPLPSANVPSSYKGAVGDYSFKATIDKNTVKTNDPFTLKLTVTGTGNISLLDLPDINLPAGFEKYEPKTNEQVNHSGKISGSKIVEYLIVPRVVGKKEIPPIEFSYFNTASNKYVTISSQPFNINVEQGEATYGQGIAGFSKEDVKLLGEDIRFIKTSSGDLTKSGEFLIGKFWFWAITFIPLIAFTGLIIWKRKEDRLSGNVTLMKYQRAEKIAKSRLKTAKKSLEAKDQHAFYSDISQALFGYLEDKLRLPKADFSIDQAIGILKTNNVSEQLLEEVKSSIETCDFARFAPQLDGHSTMQEMYTRASEIIIELEKNLITKNKFKG